MRYGLLTLLKVDQLDPNRVSIILVLFNYMQLEKPKLWQSKNISWTISSSGFNIENSRACVYRLQQLWWTVFTVNRFFSIPHNWFPNTPFELNVFLWTGLSDFHYDFSRWYIWKIIKYFSNTVLYLTITVHTHTHIYQ